jgi:hypothetical protein
MITHIKLNRDIIIPKGTIFNLMDGNTTFYKGANYKTSIDINKDNCGSLIIGTDIDEKFDVVGEQGE